jgi:hypothetical protein
LAFNDIKIYERFKFNGGNYQRVCGAVFVLFKNKLETLEKEIENLRQKSVIKEDYHRELDRFFKEVFRRLDRLEAYYVGQNQAKKR